MRVLSFGTQGLYEEHLKQLERSLDAHGLRHELKVIGPRKKFQASLEKPRYILDRLDEPVLWLDADSYVTGPIELPAGEWDIGFLNHWRTGSTVTCCAVAFRPTEKAKEFLLRWEQLCEPTQNFNGTEHDRMLIVRDELTFSQVELTDCLHGKLIVNYRIRKEHFV